MPLYRKVQAVERVFRALDRHGERFRRATGLACVRGCGACCLKEDISASPLEFLPLAYRLHREGRAEAAHATLAADPGPICVFLDRGTGDAPGRCTVHRHRGLICRLFGFSAVVARDGGALYATCREIKEAQPERFAAADAAVRAGSVPIPVGPTYHTRLAAVDPELMASAPLNPAIRQAIETVLAYYAYRPAARRRPSR